MNKIKIPFLSSWCLSLQILSWVEFNVTLSAVFLSDLTVLSFCIVY